MSWYREEKRPVYRDELEELRRKVQLLKKEAEKAIGEQKRIGR